MRSLSPERLARAPKPFKNFGVRDVLKRSETSMRSGARHYLAKADADPLSNRAFDVFEKDGNFQVRPGSVILINPDKLMEKVGELPADGKPVDGIT